MKLKKTFRTQLCRNSPRPSNWQLSSTAWFARGYVKPGTKTLAKLSQMLKNRLNIIKRRTSNNFRRKDRIHSCRPFESNLLYGLVRQWNVVIHNELRWFRLTPNLPMIASIPCKLSAEWHLNPTSDWLSPFAVTSSPIPRCVIF